MNSSFNTPILFLVFNRPDTTQRVFDQIKKIQPTHLFIAADGPRQSVSADKERCAEVKKIISDIDWPCEIKTLFRTKNLGCKIAVSQAISWFFKNVESGIILEDDCLPDISFFKYCEELLGLYIDNPKIMHIGGNNFQNGVTRGDGSYYFSLYGHIWGWATWRRAWQYYDPNINTLPNFIKSNKIKKIFKNWAARDFWMMRFKEVHNNKIDTWDYQWEFTILSMDGCAITPNTNLVTNIGTGAGTHVSKGGDSTNATPVETISHSIILPLTHPCTIKINTEADDYTFRNTFFNESLKNKITRTFLHLVPTQIKHTLKEWIRK